MIIVPGTYSGVIEIPASKSDSQRAILAAGLVDGNSILTGVGVSEDEKAMLRNIEALGAKIHEIENGYQIKGINTFPKELDINLGESGLGARLITAMCIVHDGKFTLNGKGSLLVRPFDFYRENFAGKIAIYKDNQGKLPLDIQGGMEGGEFTVSGNISSQYISGLLMALPLLKKDSILNVIDLKSTPYVQMTLDTLKQFGIIIKYQDFSKFEIKGNQFYSSSKYSIEGDWSSASYWLVASALGKEITVSDLSLESLQADKAILSAFEKANCKVVVEKDGIRIAGENRTSFEFDATDCPDLFPALASLAALTTGESKIFGLHRLEHKESNRGLTIQQEFKNLGIRIDLLDDEDAMVVFGKESVKGGEVSSQNDHRITMCLGILGMFSNEQISIDQPDAVGKSYPQFWEHMNALKG